MSRYDRIIDISKRRDRIVVWDAKGEKHFTEYDFPDWVLEHAHPGVLNREGGNIGKAFWYLTRVKNNWACVFEVDGVYHFNMDGYRKIIDYVEQREYMRQDYIDRWREEVFGKPDQEKSRKKKKGAEITL